MQKTDRGKLGLVLRCSVQFSSVVQSCPTLCDPIDSSMPGLPVLYHLLEIAQTHVHWVGDAVIPHFLSLNLWAMPCRATQDGWVMVESSDKMWSTAEGNGKPLQYSCLENAMKRMKKQKDMTLKDEIPRSVAYWAPTDLVFHLSVAYLFVFSYCSWGSQGKNKRSGLPFPSPVDLVA